MNPILPLNCFIPDVEARVWDDGRIYVYGSLDIAGAQAYCSHEYRVFSSADMARWTDHGVSFRSIGPENSVPWATTLLYAPDCVRYRDRYHLFFCTDTRREGVAVSDSPTGPFTDAVPVEGADGDGIDPAVLIDDDGQAYLYWGQHDLRGACLRPDLRGIEPSTLQTSLLNEKEHGFHEGASIRKRQGIYYLVYTDISGGKATRMSYATSRTPLGPFTKGGVIVDNAGCDRETWNNHGSIAEFKGRWFVFYHRSSRATRTHRRVCVEPISFDAEGRIAEVQMTTQGQGGPLRATCRLEAVRACLLQGSVQTMPAEVGSDDCPEHLGNAKSGDWAGYKYLDFSAGVSWFEAEAASLTYGGSLQIRLDDPAGALMGTLEVGRTGGWQDWRTLRCPVAHVDGVHALYLVFRGPVEPYRLTVMSLRRFRFGIGSSRRPYGLFGSCSCDPAVGGPVEDR